MTVSYLQTLRLREEASLGVSSQGAAREEVRLPHGFHRSQPGRRWAVPKLL